MSEHPASAKKQSQPELAIKLVGTAGGIVAGARFLWEAFSGEALSVYDFVSYAGMAGIGAVLGMYGLAFAVVLVALAVGKGDEFTDNESNTNAVSLVGAAGGALISVLFGEAGSDYPWLLQAIGVAVLLLAAYTVIFRRSPYA